MRKLRYAAGLLLSARGFTNEVQTYRCSVGAGDDADPACAITPSELAQLGIVAGMPYAKAKRLMDAAGWQASPVQGAPESLEGFPEVGCQKGAKQCATTFERAGSRSRCGWAPPWQGSRSYRALIERLLRSRQRQTVLRVRQAVVQRTHVLGLGMDARGITETAQVGARGKASALLFVFGNPGQTVRVVGLFG